MEVRASSDAASALKDSVDSQVLPRSTSPVRQTLVSDDSFSHRSVSAETSTPAAVSSSPAVVIRRPRRHPRDIDPDSARVGSSFAVDSTSVAIDSRNQSVVEVGLVLRHPSPAEGLASSPAEGLFVLPCLAMGRLSGHPDAIIHDTESAFARVSARRVKEKQRERRHKERGARETHSLGIRRGIRSLSLSLSLKDDDGQNARFFHRRSKSGRTRKRKKQTHPWWSMIALVVFSMVSRPVASASSSSVRHDATLESRLLVERRRRDEDQKSFSLV